MVCIYESMTFNQIVMVYVLYGLTFDDSMIPACFHLEFFGASHIGPQPWVCYFGGHGFHFVLF